MTAASPRSIRAAARWASSVTTTLAVPGSTAGAAVSTRAVRGCSAGDTAPGRSDTSAGLPLSRRVTMTLPVYAGWVAVRVSPCISKPVTSEARLTPRRAATRGARSRPSADAEKNAAR